MIQSIFSIEVELVVQAIFLRYGYNFRDYSRASVKRRIAARLKKEGLDNMAALQHKILHQPDFFEEIIDDFSINVTEMFRDPEFYLLMREKVFPVLQQRKSLKVWHAGCGSGEEVYSLAIFFYENGMCDNTQFYGTDINNRSLEKAKAGEISIKNLRNYNANYQAAGGNSSLVDYFTLTATMARLNDNIRKNLFFTEHNLVHDQVFGEMDLILCRNVLIYFNEKLQRRVLRLLQKSLRPGGYICLGMKESLYFSPDRDNFEVVDGRVNIFRLKGKVEKDSGHG
ncbi:MAG TPA: protein-glutamate O-methyltransferase CheR [Deltaproteobacteria bacterium]|nr:protein-glutamate O-methyltransferase CheR [Deltaproteobacteria bacterium]